MSFGQLMTNVEAAMADRSSNSVVWYAGQFDKSLKYYQHAGCTRLGQVQHSKHKG